MKIYKDNITIVKNAGEWKLIKEHCKMVEWKYKNS